jgi:hypothetical protein
MQIREVASRSASHSCQVMPSMPGAARRFNW